MDAGSTDIFAHTRPTTLNFDIKTSPHSFAARFQVGTRPYHAHQRDTDEKEARCCDKDSLGELGNRLAINETEEQRLSIGEIQSACMK